MAKTKRTAKPARARALEQAREAPRAPVIQGARAFTKWVGRLEGRAAKDDADGKRLRIAMSEALSAKGPHGKDGTALEHAVHCFRLIKINLEHGRLDVEPETPLVYLATALESLEATVNAVLRELVPAEAEAGLRAMRRAKR